MATFAEMLEKVLNSDKVPEELKALIKAIVEGAGRDDEPPAPTPGPTPEPGPVPPVPPPVPPGPTPPPPAKLFPFVTQLFSPSFDGYGRRGYMSTWDVFSHQMSEAAFDGLLGYLRQDPRNNGIVALWFAEGDGLLTPYKGFDFGGTLDPAKVELMQRRREKIRKAGLNLCLTMIADGDDKAARSPGPVWEKAIKQAVEVMQPQAVALAIETNELVRKGSLDTSGHKANVLIQAIGRLTGLPCGCHAVSESWTPSEGDFLLEEITIGDIWKGHELSVQAQVQKAKDACRRFRGAVIQHEYAVCVREEGYKAIRNALSGVKELAGYG